MEHDDIAVFLAACSKLLHENVLLLEGAANRVSELVLVGARPDSSLVVALQSFDRLKQEFEALSQALAGYALHFEGELVPEDRKKYLQETVERIGVAELRERLLDHIGMSLYAAVLPEPAQPGFGEMEIDVEF